MAALLLAALLAIPTSNLALAQTPPSGEIVLVNADRDLVERKKGGEFVARPVFDRRVADLYYAIRDADTGDWISGHVPGPGRREAAQRTAGSTRGSTRPSTSSPTSTPTSAYLLVMLVTVAEDGRRGDFYAVVPIYEPGRIWDKILAALNPATVGERPSPDG